MSYISQIKLPNNTTYDINSKTVNGHTVASDVPSNAVFTDTNNAVTQTSNTTNSNFEILLSGTADDVTRTEGANKSQYALFNPNKKAFTFGTRAANSSIGEYSTSEGSGNTASGAYSHVEGLQTSATYSSAHAEGAYTSASGGYAHAEGYHTTASVYAHAEGNYTTASGYHSHAEGYYTTATHKSQHVFGEYNVLDTSSADSDERGTYVEIVGKGTADNARSNARTLDWSGNEILAGNLTIGGQLTDKWGLQSIRPMTLDAYNALSYAEQHNGTYYHLIDVNTVPSLDCNVKQTPTTEDANYRVLLSNDADDTEHVNKVLKNANLTYNPSTSRLKLSNSYIGNILANLDMDPKYLTLQQYVNNVSIGYLQLNFNDIYNDNKWDGTNTSLKDAINNAFLSRSTINSISSDTTIIDYKSGTRTIALSGSQTYIPNSNWGVLLSARSGNEYGASIFMTTSGQLSYRVCQQANKTWYYDWKTVQNEWTLINVYDCNSSTNSTISIPSAAKELHIEYGYKNGVQIYGGASVNTLVQSLLGSSHPILVPIYKDTNTTTVSAVMYFFWNGNVLYYSRQYGSITCRFSVHWR